MPLSPAARHYTYIELADRIAAELGERPSLSTLRAAGAVSDHGTNSRVRITAGMPAPEPQTVDGRAVFRASAIEQWLRRHPRRAQQAARDRLQAASEARRPDAVARARQAGLSWQEVVDVINAADGTTRTRQWAQQRFGATSNQNEK